MEGEDGQDQQADNGKLLLKPRNNVPLGGQPPLFPWKNRWLRGDQYRTMLLRREEYCLAYEFEQRQANDHPPNIYVQPQNGQIYFLRVASLQALGFPRVQHRKLYCWKKMNFQTNLPKSTPLVTYIVASATPSGLAPIEPQVEYRMHVVVPWGMASEWVLCHVLGGAQRSGTSLDSCFDRGNPNMYGLFAFLHNFHHLLPE